MAKSVSKPTREPKGQKEYREKDEKSLVEQIEILEAENIQLKRELEKISDIDAKEDLKPLVKLTKDLRTASRTLNPSEARYLVDRYYQIQQYRTSAKNQIRASEGAEPNEVIVWFADNFEALEKDIKKALDAYTSSHPIGVWCKSIIGIGATFAAGLLAHIDAKKAPTAGAVWSYAGYNPSVEWLKGQKRPWNADLKKMCCHPDMMVTTRTGYVPIEKIKIGDEVLTHTGSWKKVKDVIVNDHNGKMLSMKTYGQGERGIMVTPNHPLYVTTRNTCNYTAPDGRKRFRAVDKILRKGALSDLQVMEVRQLYKEGQTLTLLAEKYNCSISGLSRIVNYKTRTQPMENNIDWYRAEDVKEGWLSFYPAMPEDKEIPVIKLDTEGTVESEDGLLMVVGRWENTPAPRAVGTPREIVLNSDVARLCGLFIAEGHSTMDKYIGFSFHKKEVDYHDFVTDAMKKYFNADMRLNNREDNSIQLMVGRNNLAKTFGDLFGKGARNKQIPNNWLGMDKKLVRSLLRGIFEGDGHMGNGQAMMATVSEKLAYQVADMLKRLGISSCISKGVSTLGKLFKEIRPNTAYGRVRYHVYANDSEEFYKQIFGKTVFSPTNAVHSIVKNGMWHVVRKIEELNYRGKVYNLEVEDDHSYVIEGMAVHNCYLIGESFVKVQNNPNDIYGKLYKQRKIQEIEKNINGDFAEQAVTKLEKFKIGKDTDAYKWYAGCLTSEDAKLILLGDKVGKLKDLIGEAGSGTLMLPPAHINERSKRYAVKLFLAHYHEVAYEYEFGIKPPNPYAISILGHAHKLEVPNYEVFKEALENNPAL